MNIYDKILQHGFYGLATEAGVPAGGDVFYVDGNSGNAANTATSGVGDSWSTPFSTVNYAISRCSNNAGNVIFVAADHTETIADTNDANVSGTTTDEFCMDKSGVTIIGLGTGTRRPTFTLATATDACIDVRAANCTLYNLIFYNNIADNVTMLDAQTTADGLTIEHCMFYDSANTAEPILQVLLTAATDDVTIRGCRFYNTAGSDGALASIKAEGAVTRLKVIDNIFRGDWNEQVLDMDTAAGFDVEIIGNVINNLDTGVANAIDLHGSTTGVVKDNVIHCPAGGTGGGAIVAAGCLLSNNVVAVNEGQDATVDTGSVGGTAVGNEWYVDSGVGAATGSGKTWADAVDTIDVAVGLATASNGDIIHVAAGHTETLTGATVYICDIDKKGLHILGHGSGAARPTINCNTVTDGVVELSEDDCIIENIIFRASADDMEYLLRVDGLNCTIKDCVFKEDDEQPLTCITVGVATDALANDLTIDGCEFLVPTADDANTAISLLKDFDGVTIKNCFFRGDWDDAVIDLLAGANACTNLTIKDNIIINVLTGQHCIRISGAAVTGTISGNTLVNDDRDACMESAICQTFDNKWCKLGTGMVGIDNVDQSCAGLHIFVDSTATSAGTGADKGYSWAEPCSTIYAAIDKCTANQGDIIHVAPGHEESMDTNATTHPDLDLAGITLLGHGSGNLRPKFTYDHADAEVIVDADNITIKNFQFVPSANSVDSAINVKANADHFHLIDCDFGYPETATDEFDICVLTANLCNDFVIDNCRFMAGAQAAVVAIDIVEDTDHSVIKNCTFTGAYSVCPIRGQTTASTYLNIHDNVFMTTGSTDTFNLVASSTGMIHHNYIVMNAAAANTAMDVGNCWLIENYLIADDDVGGAKGGLVDTGFASIAVTADD